MPLLIMNMGGEMIYILEQRLRAQQISVEKGKKVLTDVMSTMFNEKFVEELFKPQPLYTNASVRGIFDRLVHSSIMRLSESSMDKLYDLMVMGFKYQLMNCKYPEELLQVTLNHLNSVKDMIENPQLQTKIDAAVKRMNDKFGTMSRGLFNAHRQELLRFFQDKKIKVSLFLQEKMQLQTGVMVLPRGGVLPHGIEPPGSIRVFDSTGKIVQTKNFSYNYNVQRRTDDTAPTTLGLNLYKTATGKLMSQQESESTTTESSSSSASSSPSAAPENTSAKAELSILAQLLAPTQKASEIEVIKIANLFPDWGVKSSDSKGDKSSTPITIETSSANRKQKLTDMMKDLSVEENKEDEDDLWSLMDKAQ